MKKIPLTNSPLFAFVDDEDFPVVSRINWLVDANGYARNKNFLMHRLLLGFPSQYILDHKDHNKLNNQKSNLRLTTQQQNRFNQSKRRGSTSPYKGVRLHGRLRKKPWIASIAKTIDGKLKRFHLGCFPNEVEAAKAYDLKAIELFGEFAYLNFPHISPD